jgi:MFS family permease
VLVRPPRRLWLLGLVAFAGLQVEGATGDWSAVYLRDELGAGAGMAALGFTAFSVAMTAGRLAGDRVVAARGNLWVVRAGGTLAAAGFGLALLAAAPAAAIAGCVCLGLGMAGVVPVVFRAAGSTPGVAPGVALAATSTTGYFGFLVGPPVIGGLAELTGLPVALGYVVALSALVALLAPAARPSPRPGP